MLSDHRIALFTAIMRSYKHADISSSCIAEPRTCLCDILPVAVIHSITLRCVHINSLCAYNNTCDAAHKKYLLKMYNERFVRTVQLCILPVCWGTEVMGMNCARV